MTTPIRSSTAEMLLCLKRDSSYDLENPLTYESEEDNSDQQQLPTVNIENMSEESICNCKKSRCLKLYVVLKLCVSANIFMICVFYSKLDIVSVSREEWHATPHANV